MIMLPQLIYIEDDQDFRDTYHLDIVLTKGAGIESGWFQTADEVLYQLLKKEYDTAEVRSRIKAIGDEIDFGLNEAGVTYLASIIDPEKLRHRVFISDNSLPPGHLIGAVLMESVTRAGHNLAPQERPRVISLMSSDIRDYSANTELLERWQNLRIDLIDKKHFGFAVLWVGQVLRREVDSEYYPFRSFYNRIYDEDIPSSYTPRAHINGHSRAVDLIEDIYYAKDGSGLLGILSRIDEAAIATLINNPEIDDFNAVRRLTQEWERLYPREDLPSNQPEIGN